MTPMSTIRILLADDHEVVREGMRRLLDREPDIEVVAEAGSGEAAYRLFTAQQPDVVVLDLSMPGMGGLGAATRIRARDAGSRIVMLSAHDDPTSVRRAMKLGVLGYIAKASAVHLLIRAVRRVSRGQEYIDPGVMRRLELEQRGSLADPDEVLSNREFEVFRLLALGHSVNEIAAMLSVSPKTAGTHHTHVMQKLGVTNAAQLVHLALQYGVIDPADPAHLSRTRPSAPV